jgi:hypothetical protein
VAPPKPCTYCQKRPKTKRSTRFCYWCWLARQPIELQVEHARWRLVNHQGEHRPRVPKSEWPDGERWCAGCQSFVPDEYTRGSRCRACASQAAHASHVRRTYDISEAEYAALLAFQSGRCYVCGQKPRSRRLAVDHDHRDGRVRGLLCANDEWGCNTSLARVLNDPGAARRLLAYVEQGPLERMRAGQPPVSF